MRKGSMGDALQAAPGHLRALLLHGHQEITPKSSNAETPVPLPSARFPRLSPRPPNPPGGAARWVQQQSRGTLPNIPAALLVVGEIPNALPAVGVPDALPDALSGALPAAGPPRGCPRQRVPPRERRSRGGPRGCLRPRPASGPAAPSRDGPGVLTVGLSGRRGSIKRGSARRSCPRPPAAAAARGAGRRGRCRLRAVSPRLPSRMSPEYSLRSLLLIILATFSANASNWL